MLLTFKQQLTDQLCTTESCRALFFFSFHYKCLIGSRSGLQKCRRHHHHPENNVTVNKPTLHQWNERNVHNSCVKLSIYCWGNHFHLPWTWQMFLFSSGSHKTSSMIPLARAHLWFISEHRFHPVIRNPRLLLFSRPVTFVVSVFCLFVKLLMAAAVHVNPVSLRPPPAAPSRPSTPASLVFIAHFLFSSFEFSDPTLRHVPRSAHMFSL